MRKGLIRTPGPKVLIEEIARKLDENNRLLLEHIERCLLLGMPIPRVYMRWDKSKSEMIMEIRG